MRFQTRCGLGDLSSKGVWAAGLIEIVGTVGNLVCGAIVKPQEAGYGDQEGHVGRAFVGARSEGGVFQGWAFRRAEESAGRARLERGTGTISMARRRRARPITAM